MNNKNLFTIIAGVVFLVVIVGLLIFSDGVFLKAQESHASISWSARGLSNCYFDMSGRTRNGEFSNKKERLTSSGNERFDLNYPFGLSTENLVRMWDDIYRDLPFSGTGKVVCLDNANNPISFGFNVDVPRIAEPRFIEQMRLGLIAVPSSSEDSSVISWSWVASGVDNCILDVSGRAGEEQFDSKDSIPPSDLSGKEQLRSRDFVGGGIKDLIQSWDGFRREALPFYVNGTVTCRDSIGKLVSLKVDINVPRVGDPLFIKQLRSLLEPVVPAPVTWPGVNLKINDSDGPISIRDSEVVSASWTSTNAVSCSVSIRDNTTGGIIEAENDIGTSGRESVQLKSGHAGHRVVFTVMCRNSSGNFSDDSVVVNVIGGVVQPPPNQECQIPAGVISSLNQGLIGVVQGMLKTLSLLMQRPGDPIVNEIINIFSDLIRSIQGVINDLNRL